MISIVVADDHPVVRQGLQSFLALEPDLCLIGAASDGREAVGLVESLQPDVLVLDLMMEGLSGLEVARQVSKRVPRTRIVVLSMYDSEAYVHEALRAGAKAYVLKGSTLSEIVRAIRKAAAGYLYLSPPLSEEALEMYRERLDASELGV